MVKSWIAGINQLCCRFSAAVAGLLTHLQVVAGEFKLQTTIHDDPDFLRLLQAKEKLAFFLQLPSSHLQDSYSSHLRMLCIFMAKRALMQV